MTASVYPPKIINGKKYFFRGFKLTRIGAIKRCAKIRSYGYLAFYRKSLAKSKPGFIVWGTGF